MVTLKIKKVANGWVVVFGKETYAFQSDQDMLTFIIGLFNKAV